MMGLKRKVLVLTAELFVDFCKGFRVGPCRHFTVINNALPDDARPVGAIWGGANEIHLLIESETFPELGEGETAPHLPLPVLKTVYDKQT